MGSNILNIEGKAYTNPEGGLVFNLEKTTTKHLVINHIHVNEIYSKRSNPGKDRIWSTFYLMNYVIKGVVDVCK